MHALQSAAFLANLTHWSLLGNVIAEPILEINMDTTTNVILACDESGAKGYANQREAYPGEVGVFAGFMICREIDSIARSEFQKIYDHYKQRRNKLHIADLPEIQQHSLRKDVYETIRKLDLPCFWYAIHVEGLYDWYQCQKILLERARITASQLNPKPRIKQGSPREYPPSMHEELFAGLYTNLVIFLAERNQTKVSIEVRTDQIDNPIVRNFENVAKRLLAPYPSVNRVSGWDTVTEQKVEDSITFNIENSSEREIDIKVEALTIAPIRGGDGYTLAADVLANSLYYLFKNRDVSQRYKPLNEPNAIMNHPIVDNLAAFNDWGSGDLMGDRLFSHPKGR